MNLATTQSDYLMDLSDEQQELVSGGFGVCFKFGFKYDDHKKKEHCYKPYKPKHEYKCYEKKHYKYC